MITDQQLQNWFTYHAPLEGQPDKYEKLRRAGLTLARTIVELTPPSADQTDAIRSVRNAIMTANAALACDGK